jgi:hypothetical protein
MDETMGLIYALLAGANYAVGEHRYERAQALAAIAQARAMADIAQSLRDDEGNSVAHILHNMSFNVDVIARNTDAVAVVLTDADARDSLAQTVAIYGS